MVESGAGTILWVQRKNGSWWPGRVVSPTELPPPSSSSYNKNGSSPVSLLGKENPSVDWFNLEKSKRIKAFRCGEFDHCIEKAKSSGYHPRKSVAYTHREDAILHALELENQVEAEKIKRPGQEFQTAVCRAKRSRCVYLPPQSSNLLKHTKVGTSSLSFVSGESTIPRSTGAKSFGSDFKKQKYKPISRDSGVGEQKCKLRMQFSRGNVVVDALVAHEQGRSSFKNRKHENGALLTPRKLCNSDRTNCTINAWERCKEQIQDSSAFDNGPQSNDQSKLIDVELTVQASEQGVRVPLVSLTSKSSRTSVIGRPIEVEALKGSSFKIRFLRNNSHSVQKVTQENPPEKHAFSVGSHSMKGRLSKPEEKTTGVTCVPVRLVFSRLDEAVGC